MTDALRTVYRYWMLLLFLAVVAQVGAAGYGAFYSASKLSDQTGSDESKRISEKLFEHGFGFHTGFGYIIFLGSVILLLLALAARVGRPRIWWNLAVPVLVAIQIAIFAWGGTDHPVLGLLHGINALVIFSLVGWLAHRQWGRSALEADVSDPGITAAPR